MTKVRIVFIVSTLRRTGPTNQLYNLVKHLDQDRFDATVLTLSPEPEDSRLTDFLATGMQVRSLGVSRMDGLFVGGAILRRMLQEISPDIIHSHGFRADTLVAKLRPSCPTLCVVRNFPQLDYRMTYGQLTGNVMARRHIAAVSRFHCCVAVSDAVRDNLCTQYGLRNVITIRNGVDLESFSAVEPAAKAAIRARVGLPIDGRIWIASGHLNERKDPLGMITAFGTGGARGGSYLILLGSGPLDRACREAAKRTDNVLILGRVDHVAQYLQASDVFVSAARAEGLPNAALEALGCGLPVVLSDIAPHRELLSIEPLAGALFPAGDTTELSRLFREFAPSPSSSEMALMLASRHFAADQMALRFQRRYLELIDGQANTGHK